MKARKSDAGAVSLVDVPVDLNRVKQSLTSHHHRWEFHDRRYDGLLVSRLISERLPGLSQGVLRSRFSWGSIYLNGKRLLNDAVITVPAQVDYYEHKSDEPFAERAYPRFDPSWIVHEDRDLIALWKPAGLPTLPSREQQCCSVKNYLEEYLPTAPHMPSRLDTSTSGLMVASKSKRMHKALQQIFERRLMRKFYRLQVAAPVNFQCLTVNAPIGFHPAHPVLRKICYETGKSAVTEFKKLAERTGYALLEARPKTGRTHQIRVHAAALGLPISGDNFYGGEVSEQLHLLSYALEFQHPFSGEPLRIELPERLLPGWARD